jgi:hypothetical protein
MSYDVHLEVSAGGPETFSIYSDNYTSNLSGAWTAAGAPLADWDGKLAEEVTEKLRRAIWEIGLHREVYVRHEPSNGWGDLDSMVQFLQRLLEAFESAPKATFRVYR